MSNNLKILACKWPYIRITCTKKNVSKQASWCITIIHVNHLLIKNTAKVTATSEFIYQTCKAIEDGDWMAGLNSTKAPFSNLQSPKVPTTNRQEPYKRTLLVKQHNIATWMHYLLGYHLAEPPFVLCINAVMIFT